ncbi:MAG: flagellar basal-body MS-ring/collar protein FliF [Pseudomonadota bacterium]
MQQIVQRTARAWDAMTPRRKVTTVLGTILVIVVLAALTRAATTPTMALLYSGLDSGAASGVIEGLERQGVAYEVRNSSIYVPSNVRDRVRITLAGEGLPAAGDAGYELLEDLSGFGTTSEMFDAAFWRAKEGELARTILASSRVVRARVHIGQTSRRPFERDVPMTASVTVTTSAGMLSRQQAEAIRYLVSSAVAGLDSNAVSVIDQEHGVVLRSGEDEVENAGSDPSIQAATLRQRVQRLLEARVGPDSAVVEVSVETIRDSETIRERVLDPNGQVIVHTDTEDSNQTAQGDVNAVTVASNLADGDIEGEGGEANRQSNRTRERVNYEVSEVVRERVRPPGDVRRISVAVMVDGLRQTQADGTVQWEPRPSEELETLKKLVESAVGFDEARGDTVTIESLEFTEASVLGTAAESSFMEILSANAMSIIQILTLGLVALMLGLFVVRPILRIKEPLPLAGDAGAALERPVVPVPEVSDLPAIEEADDLDQVEELRALIEEDPESATRLLKSWLENPTEEASAA